jgi:flagellar basal body rod protein FlgB
MHAKNAGSVSSVRASLLAKTIADADIPKWLLQILFRKTFSSMKRSYWLLRSRNQVRVAAAKTKKMSGIEKCTIVEVQTRNQTRGTTLQQTG